MTHPRTATLPGPGVVAGAAVAVGGALTLAGDTDTGPGLCLFRNVTGWYCPGCGGTRALAHLVAGDLGPAWHDHPWVVLAAAQALVIATLVVTVRMTSMRRGAPRWPQLDVGVLAVANVVALVAIWAVRLATGAVPGPIG